MYQNPVAPGANGWEPDILTIVYKDQDTDEHFVYEIEEPKIEIYIVNPKYRNYTHMRDMMEKKYCDKHTVPYRSRWSAAAKLMGLESGEEAKVNPYIFNADIPIETYYLIEFITQYPSDKPKKMSLGKFDIENDIIKYGLNNLAAYGEAPVNAISYVNMETDDVYLLCLLKDDLPDLTPSHKDYEYFENLRKHFYEQVETLKKDPGLLERLCHEKFDELYPGMKYNILYYEDERDLLTDYWTIIHQTDNDYLGAWNAPYDIQNLFMRPINLGMNPFDMICDKRFKTQGLMYKEDTNPVFHKRKHQCLATMIPVLCDDMVLYSGVHSQGGVLPSHKLNYIAQKELKDTKYDYSEYSDIVHLFYDNLILFFLYNVKDTLLLKGIEDKTHDMDVIYSRLYQMFVFPSEAFTTTKVVWHSLIKFMKDRGYVPGINRNKGKHDKKIIDYGAILGPKFQQQLEDSIEEYAFSIDDDNDEEEDEEGGTKKEEKYEGAIVANPLHMMPTGVEIMGTPAKYIHDSICDMDVFVTGNLLEVILIANCVNCWKA